MTYSCYEAKKPKLSTRGRCRMAVVGGGVGAIDGFYCDIKVNSTYALIDEIAGQILESFQCQLRGVGRDQIAYEAHLKHERHLTVAILHPLFTFLNFNNLWLTLD